MKDTPIENCFLILGISPDATEEEARDARNFATKAFHPDKYAPGSREQERAHLRQIEINDAYARVREWQKAQQVQIQPHSASPRSGSEPRHTTTERNLASRNKLATVKIAKGCLLAFLATEWVRIAIMSIQGGAKFNSAEVLFGLLASLAVAWIFLAPEAKNLIDRWVDLEE